jgi:hypothetical protein
MGSSYGVDCEGNCFTVRDAVQSGRNLQIFGRKMLPSSSGQIYQLAVMKQQVFLKSRDVNFRLDPRKRLFFSDQERDVLRCHRIIAPLFSGISLLSYCQLISILVTLPDICIPQASLSARRFEAREDVTFV